MAVTEREEAKEGILLPGREERKGGRNEGRSQLRKEGRWVAAAWREEAKEGDLLLGRGSEDSRREEAEADDGIRRAFCEGGRAVVSM